MTKNIPEKITIPNLCLVELFKSLSSELVLGKLSLVSREWKEIASKSHKDISLFFKKGEIPNSEIISNILKETNWYVDKIIVNLDWKTNLNENSLEPLKAIKVSEFSAINSNVSNLKPLLEGSKNTLTHLDLNGCFNLDLSCSLLFPNLKYLRLSYISTINDENLKDILPEELPNLETLDLSSTDITDLTSILKYHNLKKLIISLTEVSNLEQISCLKSKNLKYIDSSYTPLENPSGFNEGGEVNINVSNTNLDPVTKLEKDLSKNAYIKGPEEKLSNVYDDIYTMPSYDPNVDNYENKLWYNDDESQMLRKEKNTMLYENEKEGEYPEREDYFEPSSMNDNEGNFIEPYSIDDPNDLLGDTIV